MFVIVTGEVLPGYEIAIRSMRKGEVSRFLIKPEYMFGKMGCPPRVPGNATCELNTCYFRDPVLLGPL